MARLKNLTQMTGPLAKVSMYTRQGSDDVIIRTKGGPSKRQIKTRPEFATVRLNNKEWAGCMKMSRQLRNTCQQMQSVEDYPVTSSFNALAKHLQKLDAEHPQGQRSICLSKAPDLLTGFNFSKKQSLESVLKVAFTASMDRNRGIACIELPAIETAIQLNNLRSMPYFRIKASMAGVCDVSFDEELKQYTHAEDSSYYKTWDLYCSEWLPTTGLVAPISISLAYPKDLTPVADYTTLVLCLGVEFGNNRFGNLVEALKYSGAGKVVKCG